MAARGPQPGDLVGLVGRRYRLELLIGTGGMGAVWSAAAEGSARGPEPRDDDKVAIKFLHAEMAADPLIVQRFLLEARAGTEIRHPNVVRMLASGWLELADGADSVPWLAMELLSGKTLSEVLRKRLRLEGVDAIALVADVAAGAAAAHAAKIVHRDLKPANVFLQQSSGGGVVAKVLDFGISKFVEPGLDGGLTTTGAVVGSAMYMSPEQATGGYQIDLRSDVWSLGILLYRVLTGESPLPPTHQEIMLALAGPKELDLGSLYNARIPPGAATVIRRCLRKKREERYASAHDLETDLRAALEEEVERAGRPAKLGALLGDPSASVTLITAPLAQEGDLATVVSTAPTAMVGGEARGEPVSHDGDVVPARPAGREREALPSIPYVPTLASGAPRGPARRSVVGLVIFAGLSVVGGAIALWRTGAREALPDAAAAVAPPSAATSAVASGASSASSVASGASAPAGPTVASTDTASAPSPSVPPDRAPARPFVRPKGAVLHPPPGKTSAPPAAAPSTAPEPWRRPGF